MIRGICLFVIFVIVGSFSGLDNTLFGNEARDADIFRSVRGKRILVIEDDGENFFFRSPRNLQVDSEQSIFLSDQDQLLAFDKNGRFRRNFFKKGVGPGELYSLSNFILTAGKLIALNSRPQKILCFETGGTLVREIKIKEKLFYSRLLLTTDHHFLLATKEIPKLTGQADYLDVPIQLVYVDENGNVEKRKGSFPVKEYVINRNGYRGSFKVADFLWTFDGTNRLFISHTPEYSVKIYDIEKDKIVGECVRPYKRVKRREKDSQTGNSIMFGNERFSAPPQKWENDIQSLHYSGGKLWVVTSSVNGKFKRIVDRYDSSGKYIDRLSIEVKGSIAAIQDHCLFAIASDDKGFTRVVKYRMK